VGKEIKAQESREVSRKVSGREWRIARKWQKHGWQKDGGQGEGKKLSKQFLGLELQHAPR